MINQYLTMDRYLHTVGNRHFDACPPLFEPDSGWNLTIWG